TLLMQITLTEILSGRNLVGVTARANTGRKVVVVGSAGATVSAGQSRTAKISLNGAGRKLLARRHRLKVRLRVTQTFASTTGAAAMAPRTIASQILTFMAHKHR